MKTYSAKPLEVERKWYLIDAEGKTLGRLATVCANLLSKHLTVNCLVGLDEKQKEEVLSFLNQNDYQKCIYIARGNKIPNWATSE